MKFLSYMHIVSSIKSKDLKSKLDLFFDLMDTDGNGMI